MTTLIKGSLAMVLAGAVTFSVTNALVDEQSSKRVAKEIALTQAGDPKNADTISQAKKRVEDPTQITNVKDSETNLSHDNPAIQAAFKNSNKGDKAREAIPLNKKQFSKSTTSNSASTNKATTTTPAVITKPATSSKAPTPASARTRTNKPSEAPTSTVTMKPVTTAKAPATTNASKPTEMNEPSEASTPVAPTKPETSAKTPTTTAPTPSGTNTTSITTNTSNRGQQISEAAKKKASIHRDQKENNGKKM